VKIIIPILTLLPFTAFAAEVHPEVQAALDWQLQPHDCAPPTVKASHDSNSGNERKYNKAKKKFEKCIDAYKAELIKEQQEMMGVAQHGITQKQAEVIMGNMKFIQSIVVSKYTQPEMQMMGMPHEDLEILVIDH